MGQGWSRALTSNLHLGWALHVPAWHHPLSPCTDPWGWQGVYHWTVSTGFSIAESTNFALGSPGELLDTLEGWVGYLGAAAGAGLGWLSSIREGSKAAQARIAPELPHSGKHSSTPCNP